MYDGGGGDSSCACLENMMKINYEPKPKPNQWLTRPKRRACLASTARFMVVFDVESEDAEGDAEDADAEESSHEPLFTQTCSISPS